MQRCMDVKFHLRNVKFLTDRIRIIIYYNKERDEGYWSMDSAWIK